MFAVRPELSAPRNTRRRGQWSLVGLLVSLAIIAILSAWYYAKILKPQAGSHNGAPASEQKAYGAACSIYQSQLDQAVMMYKGDHNERPPTNFEQLKKYGVTPEVLQAPGCQFQLDPATGTITEIGHGQAAPNAQPIVLGASPAAAPAPPPAPNAPLVVGAPAPPTAPAAPGSAPRGPGGITLPPNAGGSVPASGDTGE